MELNLQYRPAFTLIELLVSMAIIAILAGIVIMAINPSVQIAQAHNTQRWSDTKELSNALMQYVISTGELNSLPSAPEDAINICKQGIDESSCAGSGTGFYAGFLATDYVINIPSDPANRSDRLTDYFVYIDEGSHIRVCSPYIHEDCGDNTDGLLVYNSSSSATTSSSSTSTSSSSTSTSVGTSSSSSSSTTTSSSSSSSVTNTPSIIASDNSSGISPWFTASNAQAQDDTYATSALTIISNSSQYLKATNFGFSVPPTATVTGILVEMDKRSTLLGASDVAVRIVKNGIIGSTDRSIVGNWPITDTNTYTSYGGTSDAWGETWTPADINSSNFGVAIRSEGATNLTSQIDHIRMTVHYTE